MSLKGSASTAVGSSLIPDKVDDTVKILGQPNAILVDVPRPSAGSDKLLRVMPEPYRSQRSYSDRYATRDRIAGVWQQVHSPLIRLAAKGRIFCHPDIRDTLMAVLSYDTIDSILQKQVDKH